MAGFGSAFAQSFNADQDRIAQHNEDAFKMQYQDYISQRDYRQKTDLENKKNLRMARSLVASIPGTPPETVSWAYDQLAGGMSPEYVQKYLTENQATVVPKTTGQGATPAAGATPDGQPADPRDNLQTSAQSSVNAQTQSSGMAPPGSKQDNGIFAGLRQGIHDTLGIKSRNEKRQQQIADLTGTSAQNVSDTLSGQNMPGPGEPIAGMPDAQIKFAPRGESFQALDDKANNLGDAQALLIWAQAHGTPEQQQYAQKKFDAFKQLKSNEISQNAAALDPSKLPQRGMVRKKDGTGYEDQFVTADYSNGDYTNPTWRDQNGKEVDPKSVAPIGQNQEKDMQAVADEQSESLKTYDEAANNQKNFIRTANDYIKLLKDNNGKYDGKVMDLTGDVSQIADRVRRAVVNISDLVSPQGEVPDANTAVATLEKTEKSLRDDLASGKFVDRISQNAAKATLVDIQGTKLAYMMAAAANGSTKGISNKDFENYKNIVAGGGNPTTAAKTLQMSIQQGNKAVGDQYGAIKKGKGKAAYYAGKYPGAPNGVQMGPSFDDAIAQDPELADAMKSINADAGQEDNPGQQVNTSTPIPDKVAKAHPEITQAVWDQLVKAGTDKLFTGE